MMRKIKSNKTRGLCSLDKLRMDDLYVYVAFVAQLLSSVRLLCNSMDRTLQAPLLVGFPGKMLEGLPVSSLEDTPD